MFSKEIFRYYPLISIFVFYILYLKTNNSTTALTVTLFLFSVLSILSGSKNLEFFEEMTAEEKEIQAQQKKMRMQKLGKFCEIAANKKKPICQKYKQIDNAQTNALNSISKICVKTKPKPSYC